MAPPPALRSPSPWASPPSSSSPSAAVTWAASRERHRAAREWCMSNKRLVVLASGAGTNLQALLDACAGEAYGARVVAVGADRDGVAALARAGAAGIATFTLRVRDFPTREDWDQALTAACAGFEPDLVVMAGFMKL